MPHGPENSVYEQLVTTSECPDPQFCLQILPLRLHPAGHEYPVIVLVADTDCFVEVAAVHFVPSRVYPAGHD